MDKDFDEDALNAPVPDFSGDDFGHLKWIQEKRKEEAEFNKMIADSIHIVASAFNANSSSHKNLKHFLLHKAVSIPLISDSYLGSWKNRPVYFCIFEYESSTSIARFNDTGSNYYFAGMIGLNKNYPHTLAHPETIALKIENLFTRLDIDFAHAKRFSSKFHIMCKDKISLETLLLNKDLDRLCRNNTAEFELLDKQCYFRVSRKPVSLNEAEQFVEFAKVLIELNL